MSVPFNISELLKSPEKEDKSGDGEKAKARLGNEANIIPGGGTQTKVDEKPVTSPIIEKDKAGHITSIRYPDKKMPPPMGPSGYGAPGMGGGVYTGCGGDGVVRLKQEFKYDAKGRINEFNNGMFTLVRKTEPDKNGMATWEQRVPSFAGGPYGKPPDVSMSIQIALDGTLTTRSPGNKDFPGFGPQTNIMRPNGEIETRYDGKGVVKQKPNDTMASEIDYSDGTKMTFSYDAKGNMETFSDRQGKTWTRTGEPDAKGEMTWKSNTGDTQRIRSILAIPDGSVISVNSEGMSTIQKIDGTVLNNQPIVIVGDLERLMTKNMPRFDKDGDGHLSVDDIDKAFQDPSVKGEDAQFLAMLKDRWQDLQKYSNDEWGFENDGVTLADIRKFSEKATDHYKKLDEMHAVRSAMEKPEIAQKKYMPWSEFKKLASTSAKDPMIGIDYISLEGGKPELGITKAGIERFFEGMKGNHFQSELSMVEWSLGQAHQGLEPQMQSSSSDLFATKDDPTKSITPKAVRQGRASNCFVLAPLTSLANVDPTDIQKMITDNKNGTYTVNFPGLPNRPLTVKAPTQAEQARFAGASEHGTWPAIIEKAYAKMLKEDQKSKVTLDEEAYPKEGGYTLTAARILTGVEGHSAYLAHMNAQTFNDGLVKAQDDKALIMLSSPEEKLDNLRKIFGAKEQPIRDGIVTDHAFAVLGYDPIRKMVKIRNPWGREEPRDKSTGMAKDGEDDGEFEMALDDVRQNFDFVYTVKRPKKEDSTARKTVTA